MTDESFFDEQTDQSLVKATIVEKYFVAWARVIIPSTKKYGGRIAYIDLFAGPGRYKDGKSSTPLRVLEQAIQNPDMRDMLITIFNDKDENNSRSLEREIAALPGLNTLVHQPQVMSGEIDENTVRQLEDMRFVPSLFFIDPWGYKGLSSRLVAAVVKDWGCDCIFFFNYLRINMGINNNAFRPHMEALFGEGRIDGLRAELEGLSPGQREAAVIEEIARALKVVGGERVLPFCFKDASGARTSHHLIFVSKSFKGYDIMKEIMAKESSTADQGVPSFTYCPAEEQYVTLFELTRPLDDLEGMLLRDLAGQTTTVGELYEKHSVGKPYIRKNYKTVLRALWESGKIEARRAKKWRKGTFPDNVVVKFPEMGG